MWLQLNSCYSAPQLPVWLSRHPHCYLGDHYSTEHTSNIQKIPLCGFQVRVQPLGVCPRSAGDRFDWHFLELETVVLQRVVYQCVHSLV